ncbi:condensation domain-containing protein [Micromonospora sp. WMMA1976]|uniref:condensation domain-containing protein n=1 Tax=Micromonospora sp. WMMA1976 TaxID=3014995 RepID=UPI00248CC971|nr:condensation domain-containing protein [Micromonospora sp. WMMA1976]WBC01108.1 AMP-binding protein [Micromonospora sp. WMMA1976]
MRDPGQPRDHRQQPAAKPLQSHPSQRPLLLARSAGRRPVNCCSAYIASGNIDAERLARAYREVLRSYDALRLSWRADGQGWETGEPRTEVAITDIRDHLPAEEQDAWLAQRVAASERRRYDHTNGPIAVVDIARIDEKRWLITESIDHVVADGRSLGLLHDAVSAAYHRTEEHRLEQGLPSPAPSYQAVLAGITGHEPGTIHYWRREFAGLEPGPPGTPARAADWTGPAEPIDLDWIDRAAARLRVTPAALLLTAHAHAVARYRGTGDTLVFVAVDTRTAGSLDVFGQMTSTIPMRVRHDWTMPLRQHARLLARKLMEVRDHAMVDTDDLDQAGAPASLSSPDAAVLVIAQQNHPHLADADVQPIEFPSPGRAGGVVVVATRRLDGSLGLRVEAPDGSVFAGHLHDFAATFLRTLTVLAEDADTPLASDLLLAPEPRAAARRLATAAPAYTGPPLDSAIDARLGSEAARPILIDGGRVYDRSDLRDRVRAVAEDLRAAGVRAGEAVSVGGLDMIDRIAGFAAALAIRAVYVPFDDEPATDPEPLERRCGAVARISRNGVLRLPPASAPRRRYSAAEDPAYIIFTSGTTGRPKGVVVGRSALTNLVHGEGPRFGIDAESRVLLVAPPVVDPWICHVATALVLGATLIRIDPATANLAEAMAAARVTHAFLPAPLVRLLAGAPLPDLQMLASAGDHCRAEDLRRFSHARLFNIYGPTEVTVTATVARVTSFAEPVPVGTPIRGLAARVLIDRAATAPPGVPGELMLSGAGVALGYLDDENLTDELFPADPLALGHRAYLTGDTAVLRPDGQLVLAGRIDRQVKIRGHRLELDAIEAAARATGLCDDAYVSVRPGTGPSDKRLWLFVAGCEDTDALSARMTTAISRQARPHHVIAVGVIPRLTSGRVDEARLTAPSNPATVEPQVAETEPVAAAWHAVLGTNPTADSDFFADGGDSLNVLRLVRMARAAGVEVSPADVYRHPRYTDLVRWRERLDRPGLSSAPGSSQTVLSPTQRWFFTLPLARPQRWHQRWVMDFERLPTRKRLEQALTSLIRHTPILRTAFDARDLSATVTEGRPVEISVVDAESSDAVLSERLRALHDGIDHRVGRVLGALALRQRDGSGALVLVAHHLVIDVWSWDIVGQRLRHLIDGGRPVTDDGFAAFSQAVQRQAVAGAYALEAARWRQVLASGRTGVRTARPRVRVSASRELNGIASAARRVGAPTSRLLLAAFGHALLHVDGLGATVVDLERNGRQAVTGFDLSENVGWIGLHHPVTLPHVRLTAEAAHRLTADLARVPEEGVSYGALRWLSAEPDDRIGKFAVDVQTVGAPPEPSLGALRERIGALAGPSAGRDNHLPYHAALTFRLRGEQAQAVLDYDPSRITDEWADTVLGALQGALHDLQAGTVAVADRPAAVADPHLPAAAMQEMMLHHAAGGPHRYRPRQLMTLPAGPDRDQRLSRIVTAIETFEPVSHRFETGRDGTILRTGLPAQPLRPDERAGGLSAAREWLDSPDQVSAEKVRLGGAPVSLTTWAGEEGLIVLGMQTHHAVMDGVSNRILLDRISRAAEGHPTSPGDRRSSRLYLRKHLGCEKVTLPESSDRKALPQHAVAGAAAVHTDTLLPRDLLRRADTLARKWQVDQRAVIGGVCARVARTLAGISGLHAVTNGRDADLPGADEALGMFWYLAPVEIEDIGSTARRIHHLAAPLASVRATALGWRAWPAGAMSFNYNRHEARQGGNSGLAVLGYRDVFHHPIQVEITVRSSGDANLRCTVLGDTERGSMSGAVAAGILTELATMKVGE